MVSNRFLGIGTIEFIFYTKVATARTITPEAMYEEPSTAT